MSVVQGKVALVTGGAVGIGYDFVKSLLSNGLKGVFIVSRNAEKGRKAVNDLSAEFGAGKVVFKQGDITDKKVLEDAFKETVEKFKQLDIVINNSGILNDKTWEKMIALNINSLVYGSILAVEEYFPKYKSGEETILVNVASIVGMDPLLCVPIYSGTKHFVIGFSRALGAEPHYNRTKTRVLTICPGITDTPLISEMRGKNLGPAYDALIDQEFKTLKTQSTAYMGKGLIDVLKKGKSGSVWVVEGKEPAVEVEFVPRTQRYKNSCKTNCN